MLLIGALLASPAQATEVGVTTAATITTLSHSFWLGAMASGGEDALGPAAMATHVALFTTPALLHGLQPPPDLLGEQRHRIAWGAFYTGLGITAAGWVVAGMTASGVDGRPGLALIALADVALVGSAAILLVESLREPQRSTTPVIPLLSTTL
ncbi:MAG TPA: hypothetical protein ENK18_22550 [Deltaproteobacteria bacterium]|nr:hypothetical protein [Deltaproteobacteria bacterium]